MRYRSKKVRCMCCGTRKSLTRDHIVPKVFGTTLTDNKQILCKKCNLSKGTLIIDYRTKTFYIQPYMLSLNQKGIKIMLENNAVFTSYLFGSGINKLMINGKR